MKPYFIAIISLSLAACSPAAPTETAALEQRIKVLEAEVASLRSQLSKQPTAPKVEELTGVYTAPKRVIGFPTRLNFAAPGMCQMRFPNGEVITAPYTNKFGALVFDTGAFGGIIIGKRIADTIQINQDGELMIYKQ